MKGWIKAVLRFLRYYSTVLIVVLPILLFLPLPLLVDGQETKCGYMVLLMAVYWCTEVLPLGITALIPVFLCPLMGLVEAREITTSYMENTTMILIGGLVIAIAVENSNLHRRIAINSILKIGATPRWLILGFMLPTWFLSMWINNAATVAMMIPIVEQVVKSLEALEEEASQEVTVMENEVIIMEDLNEGNNSPSVIYTIDSTDNVMKTLEPPVGKEQMLILQAPSPSKSDMMEDSRLEMEATNGKTQTNDRKAKVDQLGRALTISVAFAANSGGTGTLIGTMTSPIFKGIADDYWKARGCAQSPVNFVSYMAMGMPVAFLSLIIIWILLEVMFVGVREFCGRATVQQKQEEEVIRQILLKEHAQLGRFSVPEIQASIYFAIFVLLLFFREPGFMDGWGTFFGDYTTDATPAICMATLLFVTPFDYKKGDDKKAQALVTWKSMKDKFPWDVLLLLGGGFALAKATETSGLSAVIGDQLSVMQSLPLVLLVFIVGIILTLITQFTSNQATASLFLPIVAGMAESMGKNPLFFMFLVALSVQFAFMLPISTAPNAIAFANGRIHVLDMVKAGAFLNILCILVLVLGLFTWGDAYFDFHTPPWDACANVTVSALQSAVAM